MRISDPSKVKQGMFVNQYLDGESRPFRIVACSEKNYVIHVIALLPKKGKRLKHWEMDNNLVTLNFAKSKGGWFDKKTLTYFYLGEKPVLKRKVTERR